MARTKPRLYTTDLAMVRMADVAAMAAQAAAVPTDGRPLVPTGHGVAVAAVESGAARLFQVHRTGHGGGVLFDGIDDARRAL